MSAIETEPIRLDNVLGMDVRPGLVDIRGRILRDGVVEAELEGRVERGDVADPRPLLAVPAGSSVRYVTDPALAIVEYRGAPPTIIDAGPLADCYWFESTMERFERAHPPTLPH